MSENADEETPDGGDDVAEEGTPDGDDDAAEEGSDSLLALLVVVPVVIAWIGIPTVVFSMLWLIAFTVAGSVFGVSLPTATFGIATALGAPATANGVPTIYPAVAGLASTAVWFALFGGGDRTDAAGIHREERRWEF